jgi:hypothetical protein
LPVKVRFATEQDAIALEPHLREADRAELEAASGPDVRGNLRSAVRMSTGRGGKMAFVAEHEGEVIALFGFVPAGLLSGVAYPWLVGTPGLARVPGMLNRLARSYCSAVLGEYPVLVNFVDARHEASVRWLKRIGFELQPPEPFGVAGLPFHRFEMRG